jgi:hypothetical protein
VEGTARVVVNDQEVAILQHNKAFGEAALQHKGTRNASIIANEE